MLLWIVVLVCLDIVATAEECIGSGGTEFYISSFPYHGYETTIRIDIASPTAGVAQLDVPFLRIHRNVTLQRGSTTINISSSLLREGSFLEKRGIRIQTNVNVSVYITSPSIVAAIDTYLALPVPCLGQQYKVASYDPYSVAYAYLAVLGTKNSTQLSIRFVNNTVISETLEEFDVYQVADRHDMTGTSIESSKPVSLIFGVPSAIVPTGVGYIDYLLEQMTPLSSWSTGYIIPPVIPKQGFVLKVITKNSNSTFYLANLTHSYYNVSSQTPQEFLMGTDPVVVTSSSPVSVIQFGVGKDFDYVDGDPFMTVVPAVDNFLSQYYFVVPETYSDYTNYLSVIVLNTDVNSIRLDGSPLGVVIQYKVPSPFNNYTVVISNISTGYHELRNENMKGRFGAIVYGLKRAIGYGFPVGFAFYVSEMEYGRKTCYQCDNMFSLEVCDVVQKCYANQVCYTEKYVSSARTYFQSGCINRDQCRGNVSLNSKAVCAECCYDNFCNNRGCGNNNFPDRDQRGPMCYDCLYIENPEDCSNVTLCASNEVCGIEDYRWGDKVHYKMGCAHPWCAPVKRSLPVQPVREQRSRRSTPVCLSCCSDDFCNQNCTSSTTGGPQIVG